MYTTQVSKVEDFDWLSSSLVCGMSSHRPTVMKGEPGDRVDIVFVSSEDFFTPFDWNRPAKTTDFGADGHTASLSDYMQLLQITAPYRDQGCGLVYARGNFPDSPDAILSRAQNEGSGSWGFRFSPQSEIRRGDMKAQGWINFRWPFMSFDLVATKIIKGQVSQTEQVVSVGELHTCSFVNRGTFYQILRIQQSGPANDVANQEDLSDPNKVPEIRPREHSSAPHDVMSLEDTKLGPSLDFTFGGEVRFACSCANQEYQGRSFGSGNELNGVSLTQDQSTRPSSDKEIWIKKPDMNKLYVVESTEDNKRLSCTYKQLNTRMDMQLFINQKPIAFSEPPGAIPMRSKKYASTGTEHSVPLREKPSIVIMAISLNEMGRPVFLDSSCPSDWVAEYLGITGASENSTAQIWRESYGDRMEDEDHLEMRMVASCVERILTVSSVPRMSRNLSTLDAWSDGGPDSDSMKGTEQSSVAESLESKASSPTEGPEAKKEINTGRPTYIKVHKKFMETDILKIYRLPWQWDKSDPNYILIKQWVSPRLQDRLFERTKRLRSKIRRTTEIQSTIDPGISLIPNIISPQKLDVQSAFWQIRLLVKAHAFLTIRDPAENANIITGGSQASRHDASSQAAGSSASTISATADIKTLFDQNQNQMIERTTNESTLALNETGSSKSGEELIADSEHDNMSSMNESISPRDNYLKKIEHCIRNSLIGILHTLDDPFYCAGSQEPDRLYAKGRYRFVKRGDLRMRHAFLTMAIWYAMNYCESALNGTFRRILDSYLGFLDALYVGDEPINKRQHVSNQSELRDSLLHWYHFGCLRQIREWSQSKAMLDNRPPGRPGIASREDEDDWRKHSEKTVNSLGKAQLDAAQTYSPQEEEELNRLALLSNELGIEPSSSKTSPGVCAKQIRAKIATRKPTTTVNRGPRFERDGKAGPDTGPWELFCLNHHTTLSLQLISSTGTDDIDPAAVKSEKENCFQFLQSDYSFMPSWDRSDGDMIADWWDVEATSVICATLLDLRQGNPQSLPAQVGPHDTKAEAKIDGRVIGQHPIKDPRPLEDEKKPVSWVEFKPPEFYHPLFTRKSLDDTPMAFSAEKLEKISLNDGIKVYFEKRLRGKDKVDKREAARELLSQDWSIKTLHHAIDSQELMFLNVFDLMLSSVGPWFNYSTSEYRKVRWEIAISTAINRSYDYCKTTFSKTEDLVAFQELEEDERRRLWSLYPNGNIEANSTSIEDQRRQDEIRNELVRFREKYKRRLLHHLADSFVDLGTKYRLLFAQRCSPNVVSAFIYIWHTESLDTFNDYLSSPSSSSARFEDWRDEDFNEWSEWRTSITLHHWKIASDTFPKELIDLFSEGKESGDIPPMESGADPSSKRPGSKKLEERSSSIVMSGDNRGDFWTCTILSLSISEDDMNVYSGNVMDIMHLFIHRPSSGRLLCFLLILGRLCSDQGVEYEAIIKHMQDIIGHSSKVLFEGFQLAKPEDALHKLKTMLWGHEALRTFVTTLSSAVAEIDKAKLTIEQALKKERIHYDKDLQQEYEKVMETFDKRRGHLRSRLEEMKQQVDAIGRLRDGISSIMSVDQSIASLKESQTAVKQGENVRVLTLITIAYLPVSLVTSLFSTSRGIIPDNASQGLFLGLVVLLMLTTFTLAGFLGRLTTLFNHVQELSRKYARNVAQATRRASRHTLESITRTDYYRHSKAWLNATFTESPTTESESPAPNRAERVVPADEMSKEKAVKSSRLHRRLLKWPRRDNRNTISQSQNDRRELDGDVERMAVGVRSGGDADGNKT